MGRSTPSMMKRKNLLEALRAQAGERLEHAAVARNLGVADHWGFLCWSCLQYSQVVLLPIGSNDLHINPNTLCRFPSVVPGKICAIFV